MAARSPKVSPQTLIKDLAHFLFRTLNSGQRQGFFKMLVLLTAAKDKVEQLLPSEDRNAFEEVLFAFQEIVVEVAVPDLTSTRARPNVTNSH
jgi:hypothetical protein